MTRRVTLMAQASCHIELPKPDRFNLTEEGEERARKHAEDLCDKDVTTAVPLGLTAFLTIVVMFDHPGFDERMDDRVAISTSHAMEKYFHDKRMRLATHSGQSLLDIGAHIDWDMLTDNPDELGDLLTSVIFEQERGSHLLLVCVPAICEVMALGATGKTIQPLGPCESVTLQIGDGDEDTFTIVEEYRNTRKERADEP